MTSRLEILWRYAPLAHAPNELVLVFYLVRVESFPPQADASLKPSASRQGTAHHKLIAGGMS